MKKISLSCLCIAEKGLMRKKNFILYKLTHCFITNIIMFDMFSVHSTGVAGTPAEILSRLRHSTSNREKTDQQDI